MTLPILLFQGGTHGNFLSRCLSVASELEEDFDFYAERQGAHNNATFKKVVIHVHPQNLKDFYHNHSDYKDNNEFFAYINFEVSDLYILYWHVLYAAGDFGVDILNVQDFDNLEKAINHNASHPVFRNSLISQVNIFKNDGISGLREMFKKSLNQTNGLLTLQSLQSEIYSKYSIENIFEFSWFYDQEIFCKQIEKLLIKLGYEYKIDISQHQQEFIDRKLDILQSKKLVELAFNCYTTNTSMDISNFCIYEQAYLDYLIEQHLGYEIENWQEYPTNTQDINPVEAWEDVKYEL